MKMCGALAHGSPKGLQMGGGDQKAILGLLATLGRQQEGIAIWNEAERLFLRWKNDPKRLKEVSSTEVKARCGVTQDRVAKWSQRFLSDPHLPVAAKTDRDYMVVWMVSMWLQEEMEPLGADPRTISFVARTHCRLSVHQRGDDKWIEAERVFLAWKAGNNIKPGADQKTV